MSSLCIDLNFALSKERKVMPDILKILKNLEAKAVGIDGYPTDSVLNSAMQQTYEAAQAKVMGQDGNPTPHCQAYMRFEDEYKSKVKARDEAYAAACSDPMRLQNWPIVGRTYADDVDKAMDRWVSLGFKNEIENAIATLASLNTDC
jgi:hypothetical protein